MGNSRKVRSATTLAAAACAVGASLFIAAPAQATSFSCSGDVCAAPLTVNSSTLTIEAYSKVAFTGHFELLTPEGTTYNSSDASYLAGGNHVFSVPPVSGTYCAIEWHAGASGYNSLGEICFGVVV